MSKNQKTIPPKEKLNMRTSSPTQHSRCTSRRSATYRAHAICQPGQRRGPQWHPSCDTSGHPSVVAVVGWLDGTPDNVNRAPGKHRSKSDKVVTVVLPRQKRPRTNRQGRRGGEAQQQHGTSRQPPECWAQSHPKTPKGKEKGKEGRGKGKRKDETSTDISPSVGSRPRSRWKKVVSRLSREAVIHMTLPRTPAP